MSGDAMDDLYSRAMAALHGPPCDEFGQDHVYQRFVRDGLVWAIRCLNCGRRPIDDLAARPVYVRADVEGRT